MLATDFIPEQQGFEELQQQRGISLNRFWLCIDVKYSNI